MPSISELQLPAFLSEPRELIDVEIKSWLDLSDNAGKATLAKAIIALANSGGGFLIIGFRQRDDGQFAEDQAVPENLDIYGADEIQNIVRRYCEPNIQCRTSQVAHPTSTQNYPVVAVPGGHRSPVRAKRGGPDGQILATGRIYVRKPGPVSEEPQNSEDWDELLTRCLHARKEELLSSIRSILDARNSSQTYNGDDRNNQLEDLILDASNRWSELVRELPLDSTVRLPQGYYEFGARIIGDFEEQELPQFRNTIRDALRNHSGWPPFIIINREPHAPYVFDGLIEAWIGPEVDGTVDEPAHHDFWRMSPAGFFYTKRGLQEDGGHHNLEPGSNFDITTTTWRIGEILLQIGYIAAALDAHEAELEIIVRWNGLHGRRLISRGNPNRVFMGRYVSQQDNFAAKHNCIAGEIADTLPEIVHSILTPLYQLFDFWELPRQIVEEELRTLRQHTF